jgi:hypothetical protein
MFNRLTYEPTMNPMQPKSTMAMSFHKIQLFFPNLSGQKVMISMRGGKMSANAELLKAPTSEMTAPRLGIAIARANVTNTRIVLVACSANLLECSEWKCALTQGHTILNGT